jgi:hypothetical protein
MKLYFATGNKRKILEAKQACEPLGIIIEPIKLDIDEIQNMDGRKVAEHKALEAFKIIKKPVVVNDVYWTIPALNNFPGPYMKDVDSWFSVDDWSRLLDGQDRAIICHENVVFADERGELHYFYKDFRANFKKIPKGDTQNNSHMECLVGFDDSDDTIASLRDNGEQFFGPEEYCWQEFPKWFKTRYIDNVKP